MKKYLINLLLYMLPFVASAQNTSWFELRVEFGRYIFSGGNVYSNDQSILVFTRSKIGQISKSLGQRPLVVGHLRAR